MNGHLLSVNPPPARMSPRPRTVTDDEILEAAAHVIGRLGPTRFTLADVGERVGLSPATLLQRFGSKRGLMLALAEASAGSIEACYAQLRAGHASPLEALFAAGTFMAGMVASPDEVVNHLAFLQIDLSDPDFYRLMADSSRQHHAGYRALLDEAVAAGELAPCDTDRLARAISALGGGSLLAWAVERTGDAVSFVRRDLETLLAPYRTAPPPPPASRKQAERARA
jgi:AcrR family transcriptional regulator